MISNVIGRDCGVKMSSKCTWFNVKEELVRSRLAISYVNLPNDFKKRMKLNFFSLFQTLMNAPVVMEDAVRLARTL